MNKAKKIATNYVDISKLSLTDFRNHSFTSIVTDKKFVALVGRNGSGKTNIIEAASMFSPGKGLRSSQLSEQSNVKGKGGWSIFMEIKTANGITKLGTGISSSQIMEGRARQCRVDGEFLKSPRQFSDYIGIIWLTPQMDRLFIGQRTERRKFFDKLVYLIEPSHDQNIKDYDRLIMQRNRVLMGIDDKKIWLDKIEKQISKIAANIIISRQIATNRLNKIMDSEVKNNLFPSAKIIMREQLGDTNTRSSIIEIEEQLQKLFYQSRARDRETYRTNVGPHRTDFTLYYKKNDMYAENCSTGEQKNLLVSLILAEARVYQEINNDVSPILLLDEITAHMDDKRVSNLFEQIGEIGSQTWLTGTSEHLFDYISDKTDIFNISNGKLAQRVL
tara:strand:+ start:422 stop:1588 length:1167 start_codon:yes stop_codon:yes gene_type:complete